ncbi:MAG: EsaB/YukD family protein [Clostridiales bacterium]|nr:EsaB/YukD family protein [Clostridiales bacterium]
MILVEVYFNLFHRTYDFKVDETAPVGDIIGQMIHVIAQKERIPVGREPGFFMLGSLEQKKLFHPTTTLSENGVRSGMSLFLA